MSKGFSLIELLVGISLVSITALIGVPSFNQFIEKQTVISDVSNLIRLINLTRSKAIKSNHSVRICGINHSIECQRNWEQIGIISEESSNILYQHNLSGNYKSVTWSSFQRKPDLSFNPMGFSNHLNGSLYLCHKSYPELNRSLRVSKSGRVTVVARSNQLEERCSNSK